MTIEEMKNELSKAGYTIHEKMDEKLLKRRDSLYYEIRRYQETKQHQYWKKTGDYGDLYCINEWSQGKVRRKMKEKYGHIDYGKVPDEEWPAVKQELFQVAKKYIDYRYKKAEAGL